MDKLAIARSVLEQVSCSIFPASCLIYRLATTLKVAPKREGYEVTIIRRLNVRVLARQVLDKYRRCCEFSQVGH
jgi:hypothetical protein